MLCADMMVNAIDAALENRKVTLDGVRVRVTANIFLSRMVHGLMAGEAFANLQIDAALIGAQMRFGRNLFLEDRLQIGRIDIRNME